MKKIEYKMMKEKIFKIVGNNQKNPFRGDGTICNCLPAAMGMGGGYIPYIFLEIDERDTNMCDKREK